jgi:hypothetical protein
MVRRADVLSDTAAGVRLFYDYERHRAEIKFNDKPESGVITYMHAQGFKWDRELQVWHMPIRLQTREQDRFFARKTFHKACEMVREQKGLTEDGPALPD